MVALNESDLNQVSGGKMISVKYVHRGCGGEVVDKGTKRPDYTCKKCNKSALTSADMETVAK